MKHPFSSLIINNDCSLMFATVKNTILMIDLKQGKLLDQWSDEVGTNFVIEKKFERIIKKVKEEQDYTDPKAKDDSTSTSTDEGKQINETEENPKKKQKKIPKIPTPGPGAPEIFNDIKNMCLSAKEKYLVITTNSDKAVVVFEISKDEVVSTEPDHLKGKLRLVKRQPFPKRPSAIAVSADEKYVIMGDKFGDVYRMEIDSPVIEDLIDTPAMKDVSTKMAPVLGHVSMLTSLVLYGDGRILTADRDEHIRMSRYPDSFLIEKFLFGHGEFVSQLVLLKDGFLVSAGGDLYLLLWDLAADSQSNKPLQKIDIQELIAPHLTERHAVPERWLKEGKPDKEYAVSHMVFDSALQKLFVLVEQTDVLLVFRFNLEETRFVFDTEINAPSVIVDFAIFKHEQIYFALDNQDLLAVYSLDTGAFLQDSKNILSLTNIEILNDKKYPLYTVNQLRKRSEH